jgi:hypothetical protein
MNTAVFAFNGLDWRAIAVRASISFQIRSAAALLALALALAVPAHAQDVPLPTATVVHERGEFRFEVAPPPAFVVPREVATQWDPAAGDADDRWRNWLLDNQVERRGAQPVDYFDHAYQPMTPELVAEAAKFTIEFDPDHQQLAIHRVQLRRDGKWQDRLDPARISLARREAEFEDDMANGSVTALIVLPDVRANDVVRISYSLRGGNPVLAGNVTDVFTLAWVDPVLERHGRVLLPPGTKVAVQRRNSSLAVAQRDTGDATEASFDLHAVDAIRDPGDTPVWYSPFPQLEIGAARQWKDVVAWALPLYPADAALPPDLQSRVAAWRALGDRKKQAMAVLNAIQEEVRYFGIEMGDSTHKPNPPASTWARRFGDCKDKAYLTTTLLRALGMDAEPALVATRLGRAVGERLPAASAFDHVIVRLRLDGRTYWLDPTLTQQRGELDGLDVGDYGLALPVAAGVDALVPVRAPGSPDNAVAVVERFVPGSDGQGIDLYVETRYAGQRAEMMRRRLRSERLQDVAAHYEDYYRRAYGELTVVAPATASEDDAANTVLVHEHYRLTPGWSDNGLTSRTLAAYADALRSDVVMPNASARTAPIALSNPTVLTHEVRIELPEGWRLGDAPEDVDYDTAALHYRRTLAQAGRNVTLVHRLDVRKSDVEGAEVGDYLAKVRSIRDALDRNVHLSLPAGLGRSERDRRLQDLLQGMMAPEDKK